MLADLPLFWQGVLFTGGAVGLILAAAWWLYRSPLSGAPVEQLRPSSRQAWAIAGLLSLSALQLVTGALWDASQHLTTGEVVGGSDFLWPSHLVIYGSFLLSLIVAVGALIALGVPAWRAGIRDPRAWVRRSPYLGAAVLTSAFELMAIPGDAIWHALFGIDLTAWSPPHLLLGVMSASVVACAVAILVQAHPGRSRPIAVDAGVVILLALMLNVANLVGVLEWELPGGRSETVAARPPWAYPLVAGGLAFLVLTLARALVRSRWAATATAGIFYLIRLAIAGFLGWAGNLTPAMPLLFLVGAVLLDLRAWKGRLGIGGAAQHAIDPLVFSVGFAAGALPALTSGRLNPPLGAVDLLTAFGLTLVLGAVLSPVGHWLGLRLRRGAD